MLVLVDKGFTFVWQIYTEGEIIAVPVSSFLFGHVQIVDRNFLPAVLSSVCVIWLLHGLCTAYLVTETEKMKHRKRVPMQSLYCAKVSAL